MAPRFREDLSMGYGLRFSMEIYGIKQEKTVFHEYLQEACFVLTEMSGNLCEFTGECKLGILYSSSLLSCAPLLPCRLRAVLRVGRIGSVREIALLWMGTQEISLLKNTSTTTTTTNNNNDNDNDDNDTNITCIIIIMILVVMIMIHIMLIVVVQLPLTGTWPSAGSCRSSPRATR